MVKEKIEQTTMYIILDNGLSIELEFPNDVFDEVISRLSKAMEFGCQFSMDDYCDDVFMTIGENLLGTLNGKRIIGYQY